MATMRDMIHGGARTDANTNAGAEAGGIVVVEAVGWDMAGGVSVARWMAVARSVRLDMTVSLALARCVRVTVTRHG